MGMLGCGGTAEGLREAKKVGLKDPREKTGDIETTQPEPSGLT